MNKDERIKILEDALVEERANAKQSRTGNLLIAHLRDHNIDPHEYFSEKATEELRAEGKIGPDASKPRSWQITDERKEAIQAMSAMHINVDCPECGALLYFSDIADYRNVLRAMLEEAGQ